MTALKITQCPACGSDAAYRYGKTENDKERRICLVCNQQYVVERSWAIIPERPLCPECGEPMHMYRRLSKVTR